MQIQSVRAVASNLRPAFKGSLTEAQQKRLEYLQNKHAAASAMAEGFNSYALSTEEYKELDALVTLKNSNNEVATTTRESSQSIPTVSIYNPAKYYGVPESTFWGDWAR